MTDAADQEQRNRLPTKLELMKLPRWALVALASRCARLLEPHFAAAWPNAPEAHRNALRRAIEIAANSAVCGELVEGHRSALDAASDAGRARRQAVASGAGARPRRLMPPEPPRSRSESARLMHR